MHNKRLIMSNQVYVKDDKIHLGCWNQDWVLGKNIMSEYDRVINKNKEMVSLLKEYAKSKNYIIDYERLCGLEINEQRLNLSLMIQDLYEAENNCSFEEEYKFIMRDVI